MNLFKGKKSFNSFFGLESGEEHAFEYEQETEFSETTQTTAQQTEIPKQDKLLFNDRAEDNTSLSSVDLNQKVIKMNNYQSEVQVPRKAENKRIERRVTVYEPRTYSEVKEIAQALFRKEIVILTFSYMNEKQARRVVDFMTGTVYALDGDIQRIGEDIFLCTPDNVDVNSSVAQSLIAAHLANY